jgi:hypothetical protein
MLARAPPRQALRAPLRRRSAVYPGPPNPFLSLRKWSPEPVRKRENRAVARMVRALCRTRTGDPFLYHGSDEA